MKVVYVDYCNTLYKGFSLSDFQKFSELESGFLFRSISICFRLLGKIFKREELKIFAFKALPKEKLYSLEQGFSSFLTTKRIETAWSVIKDYKKKGFKIVVVSASLKDIIRSSDTEGFFDDILARELIDFSSPLFYGELKVKKIQYWESQQSEKITERVAFGDHISDLWMLRFADKAFVVNSSDQNLRRIALKNDWVLLDE